jgi:hypothetical protein
VEHFDNIFNLRKRLFLKVHKHSNIFLQERTIFEVICSSKLLFHGARIAQSVCLRAA